jgi:hypothetical protein
METLVSEIPAGDGKIANFFYSVVIFSLFRRPLDERDYRYDGGGGADRWGPDTDRRRDAHPYNPDPMIACRQVND